MDTEFNPELKKWITKALIESVLIETGISKKAQG